jgi:hypothetical protein
MVLVAKIGLGVALCVALAGAVCGPPPRRSPVVRDLRRLLLGSLALDGAGIAAALDHRIWIAVVTSAVGVMAAAGAGWLSRGVGDGEDPPSDPVDSPPPPTPDDGWDWDWDRLDHERRGWERTRDPLAR